MSDAAPPPGLKPGTTWSNNDATFLGSVLEGMFFGMLVVTYFLFRWVRKGHRGRDYFNASITTLVFLCTVYFALDTSQQYLTILADVENDLLSARINLAASVMYSIIDWLSQCILIYRCWVIWGRRYYIIIVPLLISTASLALEFVLINYLAIISSPTATGPIILSTLPKLLMSGKSAFALSLAVNSLTTSLIVLRIVLLSQGIQSEVRTGASHIRTAIAMMAETGLMTFVVQLLWVILFSQQDPETHSAFFLIGGPTTMIYGLTPTLLAVRVGMGASIETRVNDSSLQFASMNHPHSQQTQTTRTIGSTATRTGGINVELSTFSDVGKNGSRSDWIEKV